MNLFFKRAMTVLLAILVLISVIPITAFAQVQSASVCQNGHNYGRKINSVAHRGYSKYAPENTLPAYTKAKENGFFFVECDVAYTKDNVPVLLHLDDIKHTSNGSGTVSQFTYNQLLNYDFGSWKGAEFIGTKIPTFEEFVALCAQIDFHPYIELKESGNFTQQKINKLVEILDKYDMLHRCTWITFIHDYLFFVRNCDPTARMGLLWPNDVNSSLINKANSLKTSTNDVFLNSNYANLTSNGIHLASQNGYALEVYTINTEDEIRNMPEYISGVTSDWLVAQNIVGQPSSVVTKPTCTEKGYTTYTCIDCGDILVANYVDALGHWYADNGECLRCEFEGDKYTYYLNSASNGGSDNNTGLSPISPIATLDKAINIAKLSGVKRGETITVNIKGSVGLGGNINNNGISTNWEVLTSHDFKVIVTSSDGTAVIGDGNKNVIFGGDIQFDNIKINAGNSWKVLCFDGHNVSFNNTTFTSDSFDLVLGTRAQRAVSEDIQVDFNIYRPKIFVGNNYQTITFNKKFTLNLAGNYTNTGDIILVMAAADGGKTIYNSGAEIITNVPNGLNFQNGNKVEIGNNSYLNIINKVTNKTVNISSVGLTSVALSKTWVINMLSENAVTSTEQPGVFALPVGYVATATSNSGTFKSSGCKLTVSAGQYNVTTSLCTNHSYSTVTDTQCDICMSVRDITEEPCSHIYEWRTDKPANCGENGEKHEECSVCGDVRNLNTEIPATGEHTYTNEVDAFCNVCEAKRDVVGEHLIKEDGKWLCYKDGERFLGTGFIKFSGKYFYVQNGEWSSITTLVKYNGKWFYISGGKWNKTITELIKYSGKWFYIKNGIWSTSVNDVVVFKDKHFFIKRGKWDSSVTTLFKKDGKYLAVKNGKWYMDKAIITYSGKKFYVDMGYAQLSFTGKVVINAKTYKIKNGKLI